MTSLIPGIIALVLGFLLSQPKKCKCPRYKDFECKYHNPASGVCEY